jgi:hypothetical protein
MKAFRTITWIDFYHIYKSLVLGTSSSKLCLPRGHYRERCELKPCNIDQVPLTPLLDIYIRRKFLISWSLFRQERGYSIKDFLSLVHFAQIQVTT